MGSEGNREGCWGSRALLVSWSPGPVSGSDDQGELQLWQHLLTDSGHVWGPGWQLQKPRGPLAVGAGPSSSSSSSREFHLWSLGNVAYKLLSFTESAFFFMNHAGSASSLSVCKTTNQETFDLTQAGKIPSITRGKCWSSRERLRAGDSPRGWGWRRGRGPSWASPKLWGGWETPPGSRDIRSRGRPNSLASWSAFLWALQVTR